MLSIGDRVKVGVDRGVVCYTGAVEGYSGDWVGIDWDDPLRGKHDGTLDGKVYFCARSAKSGSFVRPQAVSVGRNLLEEIEDKYVNNGPSDKIYGRINLHHTNLNVYKKQSNPWALKTIIVDGMRVASAPCKNCSPFTNCTELNLHNNLLSRWCDLLDILSFFPSLRCLLASCNHMERRMESVADDRVVTAPLHTLAFGECCVDDETAKKIMYHFPYVRIIYLDHNNIQTFDPGEFGQNLESIDLEGNPINDFSNLQFLSTLPKLQSLNVAHCGFRDIRIPDNGFSSLSSLNISNNPMDNKLWVLELAKLPSLEKLNYTKNSIVDSGNDLNEIIISAIPQLRFLCHSEVTLQERSSAEIYFLNKYGVPPVAHEYKFIIERLVKIYGEPLNHPCASYGKIGLLKLKLSCGGQVMERLFPDTMTVQRLIGIISRLFRLDSRNISLQSQDHSGSIMDLDKPLRSLSFYSLSDGDTICAIVA
ncbi:unnamed protein product [Thelazia callipaeda]|uniref:Tubulin-specific chaperone E n=1 Tax=Thelazia callipaeda TaxID=103827 RepID=A0A0N5D5J9_THECL|nr:unnamed protein product [Thelazia callipaeda]